MKIIFFGTSSFAAPSLESLAKSDHELLLVLTRPDKPKGRSGKPSPPPVKETAIKYNIKVLQPETLDKTICDKLKTLKPDLFVVIAYGHILSKELLRVPKIYSINVHASLLPKYRGAAPINRAIINGEMKTGITVIRMNERLDEGDMISSRKVKIDKNDSSLLLNEKLSKTGSALLLETLEDIGNGEACFKKQDSACATYAQKLTKEEGIIDWKDEVVKIHNKVRGLLPWPGAYTKFGSKTLKILKAEPLDEKSNGPGVIIIGVGGDIIVGTGLGCLKILELQLEAGKKMDAASFLRGHKIHAGDVLGVSR